MVICKEKDLTALFGNLLDNAFDATKNIPKSYIELNAAPSRKNSNEIIITMINSCETNPFSKNIQRLISTKQNKRKHGYGMKSIQMIIKI